MAKRRRVLPARKAVRDDDSLLIRSAESLGRVIGSLQRQLQGGSKRLSAAATKALDAAPDLPALDDVFGGARRGSRKRTGTRKARTSARTGATRQPAPARKTSGSRKRSSSRTSQKKR